MRKRRRRRGLGSSAAQHERRATTFYHDATGAAGDAVRHAVDGNCRQAVHELQRANRIYGSALEASAGAGWKSRLPQTAADAMERAELTFKNHCVRR